MGYLHLLMCFSSLLFEESFTLLTVWGNITPQALFLSKNWYLGPESSLSLQRPLWHRKASFKPLSDLNGKVIVWVCTVLLYILFHRLSISDGVTGLKELAFLRDLAEQNSGKYGMLDRTALPVIKGSMMVLNQLSNLETTVGRFYTNLPNRMIDEAVFSLPFSDEMGDGKFGKSFLLKEGEKKWTWVHQYSNF